MIILFEAGYNYTIQILVLGCTHELMYNLGTPVLINLVLFVLNHNYVWYTLISILLKYPRENLFLNSREYVLLNIELSSISFRILVNCTSKYLQSKYYCKFSS